MEPTYAFIGAGNMGRALVGGLISSGHPASHIRIADAFESSRQACRELFDIAVYANNHAAAENADVVVLAVKPQQMREVALDLGLAADDATLYLSIAAGITTTHLAAWIGSTRAIVRCMPNTPALVGSGAAALFANACVSDAQRALAARLLAAVGSAEWLDDEGLMDAVTAISGSGPAYFFLFIELIEKVAQELGLSADLARSLALETAYGAAKLARDSAHAPASLREQVTSPGGTTERALHVFGEAKLEAIVRQALTAARDRSVEIARQVEA